MSAAAQRPRRASLVGWSHSDEWTRAGRPARLAELDQRLAVGLRGALDEARCGELVPAVLGAEGDFIRDYGDEQFTLGRAFYTHLEQGRTQEYFSGAAASDATVERHLPGLQGELLALLASLVGGRVVPRPGFCGPGVHVFPPGLPVARSGGVIHADLQGLTPHQIRAGWRTLTLVVALQPPDSGGGLRLWDVLHHDTDALRRRDVGRPAAEVSYRTGDALLFDGRRVHQILPFQGGRCRVTATLHALEIDAGHWEAWF